ncbi:MAG: hypothetical protein KJ808_07215 [Acidobacteria bacterium]|nr:hypothetical protein [Acidobacteriota bacterium]MBU4307979.1 hypothetical protein [Acidobacteriota bacterium]MBU4405835.1 hypothetical protein [Acidobacteriota bacterium]MCG2810685.1 hypothetical protein [Candidatus Aminicenantes bacterium]
MSYTHRARLLYSILPLAVNMARAPGPRYFRGIREAFSRRRQELWIFRTDIGIIGNSQSKENKK